MTRTIKKGDKFVIRYGYTPYEAEIKNVYKGERTDFIEFQIPLSNAFKISFLARLFRFVYKRTETLKDFSERII